MKKLVLYIYIYIYISKQKDIISKEILAFAIYSNSLKYFFLLKKKKFIYNFLYPKQ